MIEKICTLLSNKIADNLKVSGDEKAVIHYGLFAIIHTSISILSILVVGGIFGVLIPAFLLSLATAILRKYSGGAHARTPESCAVIGVIISVGGAWGLSKVSLNVWSVMLCIITILSFSFYKVYQLAPVDSLAKPIRKQEKKETLKKKSIKTLGVYGIGIIALFVIYFIHHIGAVLVWIMCIGFGILWQAFTLTPLGHLVVDKIDLFLIHIIFRKKGENKNEKD